MAAIIPVGVDAVAVTLRLFAGVRAAADGTSEIEVAAAPGATVTDLLDQLVVSYPGTGAVLAVCSFLLDGVRARPDAAVGNAATLDILPPFSGG